MTSSPRRIGSLDAVRGVAILSVIATHSLSATVAFTGSYNIPTAVFHAFDFAQFGVPLFFALSGWLMYSLYTGRDDFSPRVYWSRRIARIWPLWAIFTVISFALYGLPSTSLPVILDFVIVLLFLGWISPILIVYPLGGVTIQQEMGHYALFSVLRKRGPMVIALSVIAGYASWAGATFALGHVEAGSLLAQALEAWLRLALFRSWPFFVVGGAAFVIYRRWSTHGFREGLAMRPWTAVVVTVAVLMSFLTTYAQGTPGFFVLGFVALAAVLAICANQIPAIGPALRSIGKYSYFMYFMHFVILRWIQDLYTGSDLPQGGSTSGLYNVGALIVTVIIAAALSWTLGWVSWRVLESPVLNWTRRRIS